MINSCVITVVSQAATGVKMAGRFTPLALTIKVEGLNTLSAVGN